MVCVTKMPPGINPVWIYDVSYPVGTRWYSRPDDVMLLQFSLNKVYAGQRAMVGGMAIGPLSSMLAVDGVFGPKTLARLLAYQASGASGSWTPQVPDGQVDPVHRYIAGRDGDPIGRTLWFDTQVKGFTMFRLASEVLHKCGKMLDEYELPALVQRQLR